RPVDDEEPRASPALEEPPVSPRSLRARTPRGKSRAVDPSARPTRVPGPGFGKPQGAGTSRKGARDEPPPAQQPSPGGPRVPPPVREEGTGGLPGFRPGPRAAFVEILFLRKKTRARRPSCRFLHPACRMH